MEKNNIKSVLSGHGPIANLRSRTSHHLHSINSHRSDIRSIDRTHVESDEALLNQIGYKQELRRHYSTFQVFGIAYSIMGLLPSICSTINGGLEAGPAGFVWGYFVAGFFILLVGFTMTFLGSSIPTSGGLYYWTNYYAPDSIRVPLSFLIGCSNTIGLCGGACSICYGFAVEVLSAVVISTDGTFEITDGKTYGIFAACVVLDVIICCTTTQHSATLQSISTYINSFIIVLFFIALPIGVAKNHSFNDASYIFNNFENSRDWSTGWSFVLSWMPAIWTIGAFDSVIHCSEEAKNAQRSIPVGILGSISVCWIVGWCICIVSAACIKDGDVSAAINSVSGNAMAQIIYDALGKQWAVAFMALISVGQFMMSISIFTAISRQIWAFARDDGLPVVYNYVKVVNPTIAVPVRATIFGGIFSLLIGLLVLIPGGAGANALFSLGVTSNYLSWITPVILVVLPVGASRFVPGPFYLGKKVSTAINYIAILWAIFVIIMAAFPDNMAVDKDSMNYTCVMNGGAWILAMVYYYVHGYKVFTGPKSNLDEEEHSFDGVVVYDNIEAMMDKDGT